MLTVAELSRGLKRDPTVVARFLQYPAGVHWWFYWRPERKNGSHRGLDMGVACKAECQCDIYVEARQTGGRCTRNPEEDVTTRQVTRLAVESHDQLPPRAIWGAELERLLADQGADGRDQDHQEAVGVGRNPLEAGLEIAGEGRTLSCKGQRSAAPEQELEKLRPVAQQQELERCRPAAREQELDRLTRCSVAGTKDVGSKVASSFAETGSGVVALRRSWAGTGSGAGAESRTNMVLKTLLMSGTGTAAATSASAASCLKTGSGTRGVVTSSALTCPEAGTGTESVRTGMDWAASASAQTHLKTGVGVSY